MRIAGVNISDDRQVGTGLTAIYGVGRRRSQLLLAQLNINAQTKVGELTSEQTDKLRQTLAEFKIEGDLRTQLQQQIKHHVTIQDYRGIRHGKKLPVRGQRTKTNARTKRGKRVTVGSGRKPAAQKT